MIRRLLHKYDRPGPRYTSYPTVPEWSDQLDPDAYIKALDRAAASRDPLSLYVHIPFCRSRCFYCGCNTCITKIPDKTERYLNAIGSELRIIGDRLGNRTQLSQLHWGGGTPTFLNEKQIAELFANITQIFHIETGAEVAIEVDPRVTTSGQLILLSRLGFNRISLGVQDFTPMVQEAIGRYQTYEQTKELFDLCRELGFGGINIDLIYGLPRQTVPDFTRTIEQVIGMGVDRVAVYSYAHLPSLKANQRKIDEAALPNTELKYELFATAVEKFLEAGYVQIGMDHFARPDDDLARAVGKGTLHRNFMGYTAERTDDMIGLGMSSIGYIGGCFVQNISKLTGYMDAIETGRPAIYRGMQLSPDDIIRRRVILSIMCNGRLDYEALTRQFDITYDRYFADENSDLQPFIDDGLLVRTDTGLTVSPQGMIFVRNIAMVFDAYLRQMRDGKAPLFSRTI